MKKKHVSGPVVVVTGASRGIGRCCAARFAEAGCKVIGTSREPGKIDEQDRIAGVEYAQLDVTDPVSLEVFSREFSGSADILINNVGLSQIGAAEDVTEEELQLIFQTNLFASVLINRPFIKAMRERGRGTIIHVSSLAARTPVPFSSLYAASKAALDAYSAALRIELRPFGISVKTVYFDFTNTSLQQLRHEGSEAYRERIEHGKKMRDASIAGGMSPDHVAKKIVSAALQDRDSVSIPIGRRTARFSLLVKLLPQRFISSMIERRYEV